MSYNILGINPFHNGSACVLSDGEVIYFLEEERLSKRKYDANPFRIILDILNRFKIDEVIIGGINDDRRYLSYYNECPFESLIHKFDPTIPVQNVSDFHHTLHSTQAFYNSGFKESLGVVIDGGGSVFKEKGREKDSIYVHSLGESAKILYKHYFPTHKKNKKSKLSISSAYSAISNHLGFKPNEEGKTMGLSSYGKLNNIFPPLFEKDFTSNSNFLYEVLEESPKLFNGSKIFLQKFKFTLLPPKSPFLPKDFSQEEKDLAWRIQNDTQQLVGDYIEKAIQETNIKQVCCSGGYFLNCVANYYLTKRFPDVEFYFEPISHDGGTAIGAAKLLWYKITQDTTIRSQKTLYYGPKYSKEDLLKGIQKYLD